MTNEEKILEILGDMKSELTGINDRLDHVEANQTQILVQQEQMQAQQERMQNDLVSMNDRLSRVEATQTQMRVQLEQMRVQQERMQKDLDSMNDRLSRVEATQTQMQVQLEQMRIQQKQMQSDLTAVKLRLEVEVDRGIKLLAEGHASIVEKMIPERRVAKLEDDVIVLNTAVKLLAQDVSELKKAQ